VRWCGLGSGAALSCAMDGSAGGTAAP
jgi:hypothetical protein